MLLRWLVNQYVRDAAQGKMREVVTDLVQSPRTGTRQQPAAPTGQAASASDAAKFLP